MQTFFKSSFLLLFKGVGWNAIFFSRKCAHYFNEAKSKATEQPWLLYQQWYFVWQMKKECTSKQKVDWALYLLH